MEHGTIHRSPVNGQPEFGQDEIKQPNHYTWRGKECEQIIGDITQGSEGKEAYYLGAAVKYLYRYPAKGTAIKDLQKAKRLSMKRTAKLDTQVTSLQLPLVRPCSRTRKNRKTESRHHRVTDSRTWERLSMKNYRFNSR